MDVVDNLNCFQTESQLLSLRIRRVLLVWCPLKIMVLRLVGRPRNMLILAYSTLWKSVVQCVAHYEKVVKGAILYENEAMTTLLFNLCNLRNHKQFKHIGVNYTGNCSFGKTERAFFHKIEYCLDVWCWTTIGTCLDTYLGMK